MSNAEEIYSRLVNQEGITKLIGTQEGLFIDFKTSSSTDGAPTNDDKSNLKEAISGFSNQEGGVIVWGIDCRTNDAGVDEAISENPIENIGEFQKRLADFLPYTTEPLVDGIQNKIIFVGDDAKSKKGFLLFFIPKTYKPSRVLNPKKSVLFFKRFGSQFRPVETTEEIRSLFFRQNAPEFRVDVSPTHPNNNEIHLVLSIVNVSRVSAKSVSVFVHFSPGGAPTFYDGGGNDRWDIWKMAVSGGGSRTFLLNSGFMLHPEQDSRVFTASGYYGPQNVRPNKLNYVVYAENMEPLEGEIDL